MAIAEETEKPTEKPTDQTTFCEVIRGMCGTPGCNQTSWHAGMCDDKQPTKRLRSGAACLPTPPPLSAPRGLHCAVRRPSALTETPTETPAKMSTEMPIEALLPAALTAAPT